MADGFQPVDDFSLYIFRSSEGERILLIDGAPKAQAVAEFFLQPGGIHAGRLDGIEDVQPDLDQLRDNREDVPIGVIGDLHLRVDAF